MEEGDHTGLRSYGGVVSCFGHAQTESPFAKLSIEADDAIEIAEKIDRSWLAYAVLTARSALPRGLLYTCIGSADFRSCDSATNDATEGQNPSMPCTAVTCLKLADGDGSASSMIADAIVDSSREPEGREDP